MHDNNTAKYFFQNVYEKTTSNGGDNENSSFQVIAKKNCESKGIGVLT